MGQYLGARELLHALSLGSKGAEAASVGEGWSQERKPPSRPGAVTWP